MALSTFTEIKEAVAEYLVRETDVSLQGRLNDLVRLCEVRLNRKLRLEAQSASVAISFVNGRATLPTGYREARALYLSTNPKIALEYLTPFQLRERYPFNHAANAGHYTIEGNELVLPDNSSGSHDGTLLYYAEFPSLSDSNPTNWLVENAPDVYLYGTLIEAKPYLEDYENLATWVAMYETAINDLEDEDKKSKRSGSPLVMRPEARAESHRSF